MIMDEVTMGEMPSSMSVPLLEARITSHPVEWIRAWFIVMPYSGIWRHEEDEQRDDRPENLLAERNATIRLSDTRSHMSGLIR